MRLTATITNSGAIAPARSRRAIAERHSTRLPHHTANSASWANVARIAVDVPSSTSSGTTAHASPNLTTRSFALRAGRQERPRTSIPAERAEDKVHRRWATLSGCDAAAEQSGNSPIVVIIRGHVWHNAGHGDAAVRDYGGLAGSYLVQQGAQPVLHFRNRCALHMARIALLATPQRKRRRPWIAPRPSLIADCPGLGA